MATWEVSSYQLMEEEKASSGVHRCIISRCYGKLNMIDNTLTGGDTLKTMGQKTLPMGTASRSTPCHEPGVEGNVT